MEISTKMDDKKSKEREELELFEKDQEAYWLRRLQEKYQKLYQHQNYARKGGFFVTKRRKQLLGIFGKTARDRKKYNFWYDVRETVKTALVDLQLFIETANDADVNIVLNRETFGEIISALLPYHSEENGLRAKLAQMLAESGLEYLRHQSKYVTKSQWQIFDDAIEASKQLTILLLPEKEKGSFSWNGESESRL